MSHLASETFTELANGRLAAAVSATIKLHIAHCAECAAAYDREMRLRTALSEAQVPRCSSDFEMRLMSRLSQQSGPESARGDVASLRGVLGNKPVAQRVHGQVFAQYSGAVAYGLDGRRGSTEKFKARRPRVLAIAVVAAGVGLAVYGGLTFINEAPATVRPPVAKVSPGGAGVTLPETRQVGVVSPSPNVSGD